MGLLGILFLVLAARHVVQYHARPVVAAGVYAAALLVSDLLFGTGFWVALGTCALTFVLSALYLSVLGRFAESALFWILVPVGATLPLWVATCTSALGLR
jgi:hypothetical protein